MKRYEITKRPTYFTSFGVNFSVSSLISLLDPSYNSRLNSSKCRGQIFPSDVTKYTPSLLYFLHKVFCLFVETRSTWPYPFIVPTHYSPTFTTVTMSRSRHKYAIKMNKITNDVNRVWWEWRNSENSFWAILIRCFDLECGRGKYSV